MCIVGSNGVSGNSPAGTCDGAHSQGEGVGAGLQHTAQGQAHHHHLHRRRLVVDEHAAALGAVLAVRRAVRHDVLRDEVALDRHLVHRVETSRLGGTAAPAPAVGAVAEALHRRVARHLDGARATVALELGRRHVCDRSRKYKSDGDADASGVYTCHIRQVCKSDARQLHKARRPKLGTSGRHGGGSGAGRNVAAVPMHAPNMS